MVALPGDSAPQLAGASGVLVPRIDRQGINAITCSSTKWEHITPAGGALILKCSIGQAGDKQPVTELPEHVIVGRVRGALRRIAGISAAPIEARVVRHEQGLPQYEPGHAERVRRIEAALVQSLPQVLLTGASWRGSGLGSVIADGQRMGDEIVARVAAPHAAPVPALA